MFVNSLLSKIVIIVISSISSMSVITVKNVIIAHEFSVFFQCEPVFRCIGVARRKKCFHL